MTGAAGPSGPLAEQFEDGLRFLAAALALGTDDRNRPAATSAACEALRCFLAIFDAAAAQHLEDPLGELNRLRNQCIALLSLGQDSREVLIHGLEACRLARDLAARLLPRLLSAPPRN